MRQKIPIYSFFNNSQSNFSISLHISLSFRIYFISLFCHFIFLLIVFLIFLLAPSVLTISASDSAVIPKRKRTSLFSLLSQIYFIIFIFINFYKKFNCTSELFFVQ